MKQKIKLKYLVGRGGSVWRIITIGYKQYKERIK